MMGTSDPINVAAEKLLMILEGHDDVIDAAAAATYDGDYYGDLVAADLTLVRRVLDHNEATFIKVVDALVEKLRRDARGGLSAALEISEV